MKYLPPSRINVDLIDATLSGGAYDDVVAFVMTGWRLWWLGGICDDWVACVMTGWHLWWLGGICDDWVACVMTGWHLWWLGGICDDVVAFVMMWWRLWWCGGLLKWCDAIATKQYAYNFFLNYKNVYLCAKTKYAVLLLISLGVCYGWLTLNQQ